MRGRRVLAQCIHFAAWILLAGCTSGQLPLGGASFSSGSGFPTGAFETEAGEAQLTFSEDGSYTFSRPAMGSDSGTYSVHANEITFETTPYCDQRNTGPGTYTWSFENEVLQFQVKGEDRCFFRSQFMDGFAWHALAVRQLPSADDIGTLAAAFEALNGRGAEAWNSHDAGLIKELYADDIVHADRTTGAHIEGIDDVRSMAFGVVTAFPKMATRITGQFIGSNGGLAVTEIGNVQLGGFQFTEDDPIIEVDLLETRGDRISDWTLFYAADTLEKWRAASPEHLEAASALLSSYGAAWSSGDPSSVGVLYAPYAVREDSVFAESQEGRAAIETYASHFFDWYPGAAWDLVLPFGDSAADPTMMGGIFAVTPEAQGESCQVLAAVLLEASDGQVTHESMYYEPESLIKCGWVE